MTVAAATSSTVALLGAWDRFVRGGDPEPRLLRPEILQAWLRCRRAGVDPYAGRSARVLSEPELKRLVDKRRSLIEVARPFMGKLYQFVASSSFVVLLCDERGYIMASAGDPAVIGGAHGLNFSPGALWDEPEIGNNGVGTSLYLMRPFQVSGAEHYCRKHHPWTCSGAPLLDESGQVIGALEMSGPVEATHQHTLGMVVAAAEAIQQQLRVQLRNRELMLLNRHLNSLFVTVSDGVVIVDPQGVIQQVNPVAEKFLAGKIPSPVGQPFLQYVDKPKPFRDMLAEGKGFSDQEMRVGYGTGAANFLVTAKPVQDEQGNLTSGVFFLNPIHRINKLINRFSGAHATFTFDDILGGGEALTRAIQVSTQAAASESNVLLCGESGTGKEMFAQAIHNRSARRQGPFIAVNCGALPRELIGSELFGYAEGAFTGAQKGGRPGKFELAAGGTLFLDEIGDMPLDQQVSLLRVLQDKSITRIGGATSLLVDVRIICATNKDLPLEIARGNFRQDLYYRLNVITITLPPLREHREDVPLLFRTFYERSCRKLGVEIAQVDPEVVARMAAYDWPGNLREFQNTVERMVNVSFRQPIGMSSLPEEIRDHRPTPSPAPPAPAGEPEPPRLPLQESRARIKRTALDQERREILEALARNRGNLSQTARELGVSRTCLYRKLK